jgi:hypothetical protein
MKPVLAAEQPEVLFTRAVKVSPAVKGKVSPVTVQLPLLFAVVVQLAAVGAVRVKVMEALAVAVPEMDVAVAARLLLASVVITGGVL